MEFFMNTMKNLTVKKQTRSLLALWGLTALSCLIIFFPFLFGDQLAVFSDAGSDTRQQYLMQYATIVNHLRNASLSMWDSYNGFGTSMLSLNLFNPFLMLIYLGGMILGTGHLAGLLVYLILFEIFLAGTFCYLFLDCFSFSEASKVIASYIYGLCGYMMVWGQHYQFGAFVVFLPLLLCLLERAIRRKRFSLSLPLLAAVMVCSSVYMSYMSLLLSGVYLTGRLIMEDGSKKSRIRQFFFHCASLLLGIGVGMIVFLPMAYYLLTISSRLDSDVSFLQRFAGYLSPYSLDFYKTAFLRIFSTTFQGIRDYNGYSNFYEAPVLFFTSLAVLLGFSYLFTLHRQSAARKKKVVQYLFVLFALISLFTRAGASVFNAFAYPFSRHSFLFMPLVALMCAFSLDQIWLKRLCSKTALVLSVCLILSAHLLALRETTEVLLKRNAIWMLLLALAMAAVLFTGYKKHGKKSRRMMVSCLLLLCASSVILEGYACYNDRDTLSVSDASYWGGLYDPDVASALEDLKTTDTSLYRVEKDYHSGSYCMDGLAQYYRGISTYNSTPNRYIQEFIDLVTPNMPIMAEHEYTWRQIGYYTGYSSLFGIKYVLSKNADLTLPGFTLLKQCGSIYVYQNTYVTSFARFYTSAGDASVLQDTSSLDLERLLLENILLQTDDEKTDTSSLAKEMTGSKLKTAQKLKRSYALEEIPSALTDMTANGGDSVTIPLDRATLNGYQRVYLEFDIKTPNVSDITVNPDQPLEYHFRTSAKKKKHVQIAVPITADSIVLSRYGGAFTGSITNLKLYGSKETISSYNGAQIILADTRNDSQIFGTVNAENAGFLFLPIPYEKGWTASVDGIETEILRTDAGFVSIPVGSGEHRFSFTYHAPYMRTGMYISLFCAFIWIVCFVLIVGKRKRI